MTLSRRVSYKQNCIDLMISRTTITEVRYFQINLNMAVHC